MEELFNPHSNEWLLKKFDYYKILRNLDKAYFSEKYQMYILTRYEDVSYALLHNEIFISGKGNLIVEDPVRFGMTLGASDNPTHDVYKNIVKNAYSKDNIERISKLYREKIKEYLENKNEVNISDVADHTTCWATAELLNLPFDKEKMKNIIYDIQKNSMYCIQTGGTLTQRNLPVMELYKAGVEPTGPGIYYEFFYNNPDRLPIWSLFSGPTISGAGSLTGAVQFLVLDLYRHGHVETVFNDRNLVQNAIQESLRFNATTGRFSRTVASPVTIHGVDMKIDNRVALCLDSANRDPDFFPDPDKFDLYRNVTGYLTFGRGLHSCISIAISRALMTVFLEELLEVFGNYRVTTSNSDLTYLMTASGNNDMITNIVIEKI